MQIYLNKQEQVLTQAGLVTWIAKLNRPNYILLTSSCS